MLYYKRHFISWLARILTKGVVVRFSYKGDLGKYPIHSTSFLEYKPMVDTFVINWDTKTVTVRKG